ncbi:MAG: EAL domain-containing protein [Gammaproteobacteria bacterium]|nr:EAL domain-containing protein [Gammaproteobacteria bacterium]
MHLESAAKDDLWYLEGCIDTDGVPRRVSLVTSPFRIGRRADLELCLPFSNISGTHAEIVLRRDGPWIADCNSRNGTFVNRARIEAPTRLNPGDLIHLTRNEFVVGRRAGMRDADDVTSITDVGMATLMRPGMAALPALRELLLQGAVTPHYQPIVALDESDARMFEVLGRGAHPALPTAPYELFGIAAQARCEAELSRVFRRAGIDNAAALPKPTTLFINTHPAELLGDGVATLVATLAELRAQQPRIELVFEVHEGVVIHRAHMAELRTLLRDLGIGLAYDDFGAGQARLLELVDVPPDFLKFDIAMVRNIHVASPAKQMLLHTLVRMACDLGITCLAEGIEQQAEWETCQQMGFRYAQGYLFGRPAPAAAWDDGRSTQPELPA